jgi:catechol 2,3-dioxygenase-like lactoylglutathione lyase family enzyme
MIIGAHVVLYSKNAEADRAFFRDILGLKSVDAGRGWLIFALPPAEAAFHPAETNGPRELFFMCDDLAAEMSSLARKNVAFSEIQESPLGVDREDEIAGRRPGQPVSAEAPDGIGRTLTGDPVQNAAFDDAMSEGLFK